eukprot:CAMPEP_0170453210 /NCGR_PEP_ID=MMETSP0123-20130129/1862_1 /TAXON_ID=182087 /ORGANISM="Favella ehrenbergii, Strain Fehren 1" /LENGTH=57 /DNA_ID=CAMNT_0010715495 /DNA_START=1554 /DNA_END=1727 /DNA_ORIENTATION=-
MKEVMSAKESKRYHDGSKLVEKVEKMPDSRILVVLKYLSKPEEADIKLTISLALSDW